MSDDDVSYLVAETKLYKQFGLIAEKYKERGKKTTSRHWRKLVTNQTSCKPTQGGPSLS